MPFSGLASGSSSRRQRDTCVPSASTTWTTWLLSAGVRPCPSKTGAVVTQFVTQAGDHVHRAVRYSEGFPRPHESTTVRLSRSDGVTGHLGVHGHPHASTAVVSAVLATGLSIRRSDLPLPRRGVSYRRSPGNVASRVTRSIGGRSWGQGLFQSAEPGDEAVQSDHDESPQNAAADGDDQP